MYTQRQARLLGIALRAQAIGDAIGEDFEFQLSPSKSDLHRLLNSGTQIHITDDTQMTMFGIEGMLYGNVTKHYLMWLTTQLGKMSEIFPESRLLIDQPLMWQSRAPGNTCITSLNNILKNYPVENNSNGCGTVMKALPFLFGDSHDLLVQNSISTHKGPQIIETARHQWDYAQSIIKKVVPGHFKDVDIDILFGDGGWQAESCLDIAIGAFENCDGDFNKLLELSILHEGDSDSVAATAGVLYGLFYETYPIQLYNRIAEKRVIDMLINTVINMAK